MIRLFKKTIKILIWILVVVVCIPQTALAWDTIDQQKDVSLTLHYGKKGIEVPDVPFSIYYVAEVVDENTYVLTEEFSKYPIELENVDEVDWYAVAQTLAYYIQADRVKPIDQGITDARGLVKFPNQVNTMKPGLYLVKAPGKGFEGYNYYVQPFFITLPYIIDYETEEWSYDVYVNLKYTRERRIARPELETVEKKIFKIWEDDTEDVRPNEVIVELFKNETLYDTKTLQEENNWRYIWEDLPEYDDEGLKIEWGVVERDVEENYTVCVLSEDTEFIITNTYHKDEDSGDDGNDSDDKEENPDDDGDDSDDKEENPDDDGDDSDNNIENPDDDGNDSDDKEENPDDNKDNSDKDTEKNPTLPQTGLLWWPVPVCIVLGLFFLILGRVLKGRK